MFWLLKFCKTVNGYHCLLSPFSALTNIFFIRTPLHAVNSKLRMRWAGPVGRLGTEEVHTRFGCGNLRESEYLADLGVDGWILKSILKK